MKICRRLSVVTLMLSGVGLLSGCGTIYIGNVAFTADEICSKELAGGSEVNIGCLPPTRAAHAQGLHFIRFRQQLAEKDATILRDIRDGMKERDGKKDPTGDNALPSLIGRVFVARKNDAGVVHAPETGNMNFLALGPATAPPANAIKTDILFVSSFTGVIEKKVSVSAQIDPEAIANSVVANSLTATLSTPTKDVLKNRIARVAHEKAERDLGRGHFMYVAMKDSDLDQITTALSLCGWAVPQAPMRQGSTGESTTTSASERKDGADCNRAVQNNNGIGAAAKALMNAIETSAKASGGAPLGLVTGAAIVVTEGGESEICTKSDFSFLEKGETGKMTASCQDLKNALTPDKKVDAQEAGILNDTAVQNSVMLAVSAQYSRAVRKTATIERHASVYALQWVPIMVFVK